MNRRVAKKARRQLDRLASDLQRAGEVRPVSALAARVLRLTDRAWTRASEEGLHPSVYVRRLGAVGAALPRPLRGWWRAHVTARCARAWSSSDVDRERNAAVAWSGSDRLWSGSDRMMPDCNFVHRARVTLPRGVTRSVQVAIPADCMLVGFEYALYAAIHPLRGIFDALPLVHVRTRAGDITMNQLPIDMLGGPLGCMIVLGTGDSLTLELLSPRGHPEVQVAVFMHRLDLAKAPAPSPRSPAPYEWERGLTIPCPICSAVVGAFCDVSTNNDASRPSARTDETWLHRSRTDQANGVEKRRIYGFGVTE